ncbi:MAG: PhnD/SsuA/transferrin family substrate-binding protein [Paracoccaceae bacterium]|nr:PhnD/SsuA/transferrin family substrate-binding protein [Paracoccaceae bacterium]
MIAALPMYDWPEERAATDALWARLSAALRAAGFDTPAELTRSDDLDALWRHPGLLLGQTCGLPYSLDLHEKTRLIGTPDPGLPGVPPGHYRSVLVARESDRRSAGDLLSACIAVNAPDSQSGWGALARWAETQRLEIRGRITLTGAHLHSAEAVAQNAADIAALDATSWALLRRHRPAVAAGLREVARTAPTPAPPFICARRFDPGAIAEAIDAALGPGALVRFGPQDYLAVPRMPFPEASPH